MSLRPWCIPLLLVCCTTPLRADEPATQAAPEHDPDFIKREVTGSSPRTADRCTEVVQFQLDDGILVVATQQPPTEATEQVRIKDRPGFCTLDVNGEAKTKPWSPERLTFKYWNMARFGHEAVEVHYNPISLQVAHTLELGDRTTVVSLIQGQTAYNGEAPGVALIVSGINNPDGSPARVQVSAPTFDQLVTKYPRESSTYLIPIFQDLRQVGPLFAVDSRLAWQVFSDALVPDAQMVDRIEKTITRLDADAYADREAAYADLQKLGQPAVGWISRMDRSKLSPEQRSRIDEFLSTYQPLDPAEAKALRGDVHFLLNCFYNEDKAIRGQAMKHLKDVVGKPIELSVDLSASEAESRIAQLRSDLTSPPTTQPTTAPAD